MCVGKGRASNPQLLAIARKWACDLMLVYRWIPSEYNVADRDSRRYEENHILCEIADTICSSDLKPMIGELDAPLSPLVEDASPWIEFCSQQIPKTWRQKPKKRRDRGISTHRPVLLENADKWRTTNGLRNQPLTSTISFKIERTGEATKHSSVCCCTCSLGTRLTTDDLCQMFRHWEVHKTFCRPLLHSLRRGDCLFQDLRTGTSTICPLTTSICWSCLEVCHITNHIDELQPRRLHSFQNCLDHRHGYVDDHVVDLQPRGKRCTPDFFRHCHSDNAFHMRYKRHINGCVAGLDTDPPTTRPPDQSRQ